MSTTQTRRPRRGAALIVSLVFLVTFAAFAAALASGSSANVQIAHNLHLLNGARASAESGLEVMHRWLARVTVPSTTMPQQILSTVASCLTNDLSANGISNMVIAHNGSTVTVSPVVLRSATEQSFEAVIRQIDDYVLQVDVTGYRGPIAKTIRANFNLDPERHPIFDYGLASKGPIEFQGNPTFIGVNALNEADVYIQSENHHLALDVFGNANFDGDIGIGNAAANVQFDGTVQIGGDYRQEAIDKHVVIGVDPVGFPVPDTGHFQQYATGPVIDAATDTSLNMTLTNTVIASGANPCFEGNVRIEGVLFVEAPNVIEFKGNVDIRGLIVADGDVNDPGHNSMTFYGNFESSPFPSDAQFDVMRHEAGSSLLAPGFRFRLEGNFRSLAGVMAISGAYICGNVDAVVEGTMINYSDDPSVGLGNPTLKFDHSAFTENPAGFEYTRVPTYDPSSYEEIMV